MDNNDNETTTAIFTYNGNNIVTSTTTDLEGIFKTNCIYENGKLVKLERYTNDIRKENEDLSFTYDGQNISTSYGYDGSTTLFTNKYTYNSNGQMILKKQYNNDKYCCETSYTYDSKGNISNYIYDDKINPLYHVLPMAYNKINITSKNNIISEGDRSYSYTYDDRNYPIQVIETHKYKPKTIVTTYFYE
ncbi:hypothetical protein [Flavobacterium sp. UMI-01]|uniref:hypothetical protein n=1 Tax=Flavobacterium sp. UMI-01 TaxID=1441053 RepID=UPI001C7CD369|nr:hypothetical protein [Flavobacterium sp. UMI-01]